MNMNRTEKKLIRGFFSLLKKLQNDKIVRSTKTLGDIGEWLCEKHCGLKPAKSGRHPKFDGYIGTDRVQVKLHNAPIGTNIEVGNPSGYDILLVIIAPQSKLRSKNLNNSFLIYRFTSNEVTNSMAVNSGYTCKKKNLKSKIYCEISL